MLAPAQITAARITTRTMTKNAVSAAHIIWRCQGVGYSFISQPHRNVVPAPWQLRLTWTSAFDVNLNTLVRSGSSLSATLCRSSFWCFESFPRDFYFLGRAPALFARLPMLPQPDSILNRCRRGVQTPPGPRARLSWQRAEARPKLDQTDPFEILPSRGCPGTKHYSVRFPARV